MEKVSLPHKGLVQAAGEIRICIVTHFDILGGREKRKREKQEFEWKKYLESSEE